MMFQLITLLLTNLTYEGKAMTEHISCDCKCKFNSTICNSNQKWNNKICKCECKNYYICEGGKVSYSCIGERKLYR